MRFGQGFGALALLDQMQRKITDRRTGEALKPDLAQSILATIIENAWDDSDEKIRCLGNPVYPDIIKRVITQHTAAYNLTHQYPGQ